MDQATHTSLPTSSAPLPRVIALAVVGDGPDGEDASPPIPLNTSPTSPTSEIKDTDEEQNPWLSLGTVLTILSVVASIGTTLYPYGLVVLQRQYTTVDNVSSDKAWAVVTVLPKSIVVLHGVEALTDRVTFTACAILLALVALSYGLDAMDIDARVPILKGRVALKKTVATIIVVIAVGKVADRVLPGAPSFTLGTYVAVVALMLACRSSVDAFMAQRSRVVALAKTATAPVPQSATAKLLRTGALALFLSYLGGLFYAYSLLPTQKNIMPIFTFEAKGGGSAVTGEAITIGSGYWTVVETAPHKGQLRLIRDSDIRRIEP